MLNKLWRGIKRTCI